ncbi:hypothetical protein RvY_01361 [Ramazzottius varieornatus]|uniref:Uncharacterized protein n=1 Tax=Ramazzottius varieornatus TaxID=947166 RepID=A0A1D1UGY8_RAMVA|nr:hypothetical protein RvY_01361 [Ramazzottius varieornatus]
MARFCCCMVFDRKASFSSSSTSFSYFSYRLAPLVVVDGLPNKFFRNPESPTPDFEARWSIINAEIKGETRGHLTPLAGRFPANYWRNESRQLVIKPSRDPYFGQHPTRTQTGRGPYSRSSWNLTTRDQYGKQKVMAPRPSIIMVYSVHFVIPSMLWSRIADHQSA